MVLKNLILTTSVVLLLILKGTFCHPTANWKISRGNQTDSGETKDSPLMENADNARSDGGIREKRSPKHFDEDYFHNCFSKLFHQNPHLTKDGAQELNTTWAAHEYFYDEDESTGNLNGVEKRETKTLENNAVSRRGRSIVDKMSAAVISSEDNDQIAEGIDYPTMKEAQDKADEDLMNGLQMLLTKNETLVDVFWDEKSSGFSKEFSEEFSDEEEPDTLYS